MSTKLFIFHGVIPANAGIHFAAVDPPQACRRGPEMDSRVRGNDAEVVGRAEAIR